MQSFGARYRKFVELLFHKAYLWQCIDSGAELDDFYEAGEQVRSASKKRQRPSVNRVIFYLQKSASIQPGTSLDKFDVRLELASLDLESILP